MAINQDTLNSIIDGLGAMPKKSEIDTPTNNIDLIATTTTDGLMSASDKSKLDGVAVGANKYVHPETSGNKHIPSGGSDGQILKWESDGTAKWATEIKYGLATETSGGLMSSTDKTNLDAAVSKLSGIAEGANRYTLPTASSTTLGGVKTTSIVTSTSGLTACPIINGVPYYKDTYNEYSLPTASSTTLGGVKTTSIVTSTSGLTACPIIAGVPYYKDNTYSDATTDASGLMSASDKTTLDAISSKYALKSKYGDTTIDVGRKAETDVGEHSTAEGDNTTASGYASHAEGGNAYTSNGEIVFYDTRAATISDNVVIEVDSSYAYGVNSHAEGCQTLAYGNCSHAEGHKTTASGGDSHAEGSGTIASGAQSHAEGLGTIASGSRSHAEGILTTASGASNHAEGKDTTANGNNSCHAEGSKTTASGIATHAEGNSSNKVTDLITDFSWNTTTNDDIINAWITQKFSLAHGRVSHVEGLNNLALGYASHAEGSDTVAVGNRSHTSGYYTTAENESSHAGGHYNVTMTVGGSSANTTGTAFVIGNGTSDTALSNAFSVQFDGTVKAKSTITASTTADYAEFFEWLDENSTNEDRVGYFVTLDGDKIRIATNEDDYILGVVSGEPFVLGNGDCDTWNGMYLRDEFRRTIYEPAPKMEEILDTDGNPTGEFREVPGEYEGTRPKLNPDYDYTKPYISRFDRKEWAPVGMLGVLAVRHDGTAKVNGYVTVNENGIATACDRTTENSYRVIKSNSESVVEIIFR